MSKRKEGRVEDYFIEQVELHGGLTRKAKWLCRRGCPDRFFSFPAKTKPLPAARGPVTGLAEIKAEDGALAPHQVREINNLRSFGVQVVVLSSFEDVDYFIRSVA